MPTADEFLRAITADADADAPRLAFADWLDESGDAARAEFIRVQCALAALPRGVSDYHPLRERERALLEQHGEEWLRPIRALARLPEDPQPGGWRVFLRLQYGPEWGEGDYRVHPNPAEMRPPAQAGLSTAVCYAGPIR